MGSTRQPRLPIAPTDPDSNRNPDRNRKGQPTMQAQYAQRHQVARAGFSRVPAPAFPVCAMGNASWSNLNSTQITTGKPGWPRPPSVSKR